MLSNHYLTEKYLRVKIFVLIKKINDQRTYWCSNGFLVHEAGPRYVFEVAVGHAGRTPLHFPSPAVHFAATDSPGAVDWLSFVADCTSLTPDIASAVGREVQSCWTAVMGVEALRYSGSQGQFVDSSGYVAVKQNEHFNITTP